MSADQVQEGDKVSWKWGAGHPSGVASEVKAGDLTVVSHRGNEITKKGTEENPAVHIERSGNDVVKRASELTVEEKGEQNGTSDKKEESKPDDKKGDTKSKDKKDEADGDEAQVGDKRKADEKADVPAEEEKEEAPAKQASNTKKQKTTNGAATNGQKKGPGRPKSSGEKASGTKKEKKVPRTGTAARQTRSQGTATESL